MVVHKGYHTKKGAKIAAAKLRKKGLTVSVMGVTNAQTGRGLVYHVYSYKA